MSNSLKEKASDHSIFQELIIARVRKSTDDIGYFEHQKKKFRLLTRN